MTSLRNFPDARESKVNEAVLLGLTRALKMAEGRAAISTEEEALQQAAAEEVFEWTGKWYAPPFEKVLDAVMATHLAKSHFQQGGLVLDVGCGAGRMADVVFRGLRKRGIRIDVDGLDLEKERESSLEAFSKYPWARKAIKADFDGTGLPNDTYDLVFANNSIRISTDIEKTLREMRRVTKFDKHLLFNYQTPAFGRKLNERGATLPEYGMIEFGTVVSDKMFPRYETVEGIERLLSKTGWRLVRCCRYLSGEYAELLFLLYLPYQLYWGFDSEQLPTPEGYLEFKSGVLAMAKRFLVATIVKEANKGFRDDQEGCKMYVVARKK